MGLSYFQHAGILVRRRPGSASGWVKACSSWAEQHISVLGFFWLALFLSFAFGLKFTLLQDRLTLDADPANYLVTMDGLFGGEPTGLGLARPPLIAIPMKVFTSLFGVLTGIKVLGTLAAVSIGIPFYLLARRFSSRYVAVVTSLLFVFSSGYSSMMSWGFLSLLGIFLLLLTLNLLLLTLENPSKLNILLTGLSASFLVGLHQVSAMIFLMLVVIFLTLYLAINRGQIASSVKTVALVSLVGGVFSLIYLPSYLLAGSEAVSGGPTPSLITFRSFEQGKNYLAFFFPDTNLVILLSIAAFAGMVLLWPRDRNACILLATLLFFPLFTTFLSLDLAGASSVIRRLPYLMYVPLWLFSGVVLTRLLSDIDLPFPAAIRRLPWISFAALVVASVMIGVFPVLEIPASQRRLGGALNFYSYLDKPLWNSVNWIRENTRPDDVIVAHPKLFGWWIEGAGKRNAFETRDIASFYKTQQDQSVTADLVLSRNQGVENGLLRVAVTHPFDLGAGGDPVIGVFAAGQYQDVILFHDLENRLEIQEGEGTLSTSLAASKETSLLAKKSADGLVMEATYKMGGFSVGRAIQLDRGEPGTSVAYHIQNGPKTVKDFIVDLNLTLGQDIFLKKTSSNSFQKQQAVKSVRGRQLIVTRGVIETTGATLNLVASDRWPNHLVANFRIQEPEATVVFRFELTSPINAVDQPVRHFHVPQLLEDHGIGYIAVDTKVSSPLYNDIPWRTVMWLDQHPDLGPVFEEEHIKIYKVNLPREAKKVHLDEEYADPPNH